MNAFSKALRRLTRTAGYTLTRCQKANGFPVDFSAEEIALVESVREFTLTTPERIHALHHAIRYLHHGGIQGDIVECGVWRGGSMMVAAKTLVSLGDTSRTLWMYDTYEGMSAPTEHDVSIKGAKATDKFQKRKTGDDTSDWCLAPQEEVAKNVESTGYPAERMKFVKGKVEETLPGTLPEKIALLRLDTDWYESTLAEMTHLFPRLVPGGVLLIDDYGEWQGARKAVDEYVTKNQVPLLLHRVDSTGRMAVKLR